MNRIAILTQPLHNNYGGILQNFALQKYLKSLGFESTTINIEYAQVKYSKLRLFLSISKRIIKSLLGDKSVLFVNVESQITFLNTPGQFQTKFFEQQINYIKVNDKLDNNFNEQNEFMAYIVGSDQVWRPRYSPFLPNYYLDFVDNPETIKIAYAASFGVDEWEADENLTPFLAERAKKFDFISVREDSAIDLCKNYLGVIAAQTLDPTMLLDANHYKALLTNNELKFDNKIVCVYVLDLNTDKQAIVKEISETKELEIHIVGKPTKKGFPSIESWINGFVKADFIVTDSFHGVVFSILFNKQFVCIGNEGRGLTRFNSILKKFKLFHKLVMSYADFKNRKAEILADIEYDTVNEILNSEREISKNFLKKALNKR